MDDKYKPKRHGQSATYTDGRPGITWVDDLILDFLSPYIGSTAKALYFDLVRYAKEGPRVEVFYETLATRNRMSYSSVQRHLKPLEQYALITKITPSAKERFKGGKPCEFLINSTEVVKTHNRALFAANLIAIPSGASQDEPMVEDAISTGHQGPIENSLVSPIGQIDRLENKGNTAPSAPPQSVTNDQLVNPKPTGHQSALDENPISSNGQPADQSTSVKPFVNKIKQCFVPDPLINSIFERFVQIKPDAKPEDLQAHWEKALKTAGSKEKARPRISEAFEVMWQQYQRGQKFENPPGWLMTGIIAGWKLPPPKKDSVPDEEEKLTPEEAAKVLDVLLPDGNIPFQKPISGLNSTPNTPLASTTNKRRDYSLWTKEEINHHFELAKDSLPAKDRIQFLDKLFSTNPLWPSVRADLVYSIQNEEGG